MIKIKVKGDFKKTHSFLKKLSQKDFLKSLDKYGQMGVEALAAATPVDSGLTASSWIYDIKSYEDSGTTVITWSNTNLAKGWAPIAILLQYGHATRNGGFVKGRDYINPAIQPVFDKIANDAWMEVTRL